MAKKNKKAPEMETSVTTEPVVAPVTEEVVPAEVKKYMVNCHRCGAALHVTTNNVVYMCPVCNNLFRVRIGEKLVKDVTNETVAEAYGSVNKRAGE